ncbi:MAG: rRNA maturation RNase YbeY [Methylocystaceae bacterium]
MNTQLLFENQQSKGPWTEELQTVVVNVLEEISRRQQVADQAEVGITIVDNEQIRQINAEYRGIDHATDVISFALNDDANEPEVVGEAAASIQFLLGDIIISLEQAVLQAEEYGHSLQREVAFLASHGLLHLLGFDHQDEAGEKAMQEFSESVLSHLGVNR